MYFPVHDSLVAVIFAQSKIHYSNHAFTPAVFLRVTIVIAIVIGRTGTYISVKGHFMRV